MSSLLASSLANITYVLNRTAWSLKGDKVGRKSLGLECMPVLAVQSGPVVSCLGASRDNEGSIFRRSVGCAKPSSNHDVQYP